MTAHAFYEAERERHPDLRQIRASEEEAEALIKKLTRHYFGNYDGVDYRSISGPNKARPIKVEWKRAGATWAHAHGDYKIRLCEKPTFLLIVHEFAHIYECRKYGDTAHRRRMARVVDRVATYVRRKGYAQESLDRQFTAWCWNQIHNESITLKIGGDFPPCPVELHTNEEVKTLYGFTFPESAPAPAVVAVAACPAPEKLDADGYPELPSDYMETERKARLADVELELTQAAKRDDLRKRIAKREAQIKRLERRAKSIATRLKKATRSLNALRRSEKKLNACS